MAEPLALKNLAEEKCPWRQYVSIRQVGEPAARKSRWRAVGTGHFLAAHDDLLLGGNSRLRADRLVASKKKQASACNKRNEVPRGSTAKVGCDHRLLLIFVAKHYKIVMIGKRNFAKLKPMACAPSRQVASGN